MWMKFGYTHTHTHMQIFTNAVAYRDNRLHWFEFRRPKFQYQLCHKSVQS